MELVPIHFKQACDYIEKHHRHHKKPWGWKYGMGVKVDGKIVGVITVGRPVARLLDDGLTIEVTRCCTDGTKNACSFLYAAARRVAFAMGYRRIITYTLESENGASLKASGFRFIKKIKGHSWNRPNRKRVDKAPICDKKLWEAINPRM
jgi:hypothetical protein